MGRELRGGNRAAAPHLPSGRLHGDRTKIVALADVNTVMTQNCISGRNMEMEVRQQKMVEVIVAFHVTLIGRAERERDLTIGRLVDLLAVERLQIGYRFCQSRLELIDGRLIVFVAGRLNTREARRAVLSVIRRHLHLTSEIEHVRE